MFDLGWGEMLVIAIVIIVVVGPKELPGMLRTFGKTTSKLRVMANDFRKQFDEALKEAELDDLKKVADDVRALNPKNEIRKALSPMEQAANDVRAGLSSAMTPAPTPAPEPAVAASDAPAVAAEPAKAGATAVPAGASVSATPAPKKAALRKKAASKPKGEVPAQAAPTAAAAAKPRATRKKTGGDQS